MTLAAPTIEYRESANQNDRPADGWKPRLIVVHGTAGTDASDRDWIMRPEAEVSYHIHAGRDGSLVRFVSDDKRAWHAGKSTWRGRDNCNDYSLGIGLAGFAHTGFTEAQYRNAAWVVARWCKTYGIPFSQVVGHYHVSPGRKTDPWECFEWGLFFDYVNEWIPTITP